MEDLEKLIFIFRSRNCDGENVRKFLSEAKKLRVMLENVDDKLFQLKLRCYEKDVRGVGCSHLFVEINGFSAQIKRKFFFETQILATYVFCPEENKFMCDGEEISVDEIMRRID